MHTDCIWMKFGDDWGLYTGLHNLSRVMSNESKTSRCSDTQGPLDNISVHRVPWNFALARGLPSSVIKDSFETNCFRQDLVGDLCEGTSEVLLTGTRIESLFVEIGPKLIGTYNCICRSKSIKFCLIHILVVLLWIKTCVACLTQCHQCMCVSSLVLVWYLVYGDESVCSYVYFGHVCIGFKKLGLGLGLGSQPYHILVTFVSDSRSLKTHSGVRSFLNKTKSHERPRFYSMLKFPIKINNNLFMKTHWTFPASLTKCNMINVGTVMYKLYPVS